MVEERAKATPSNVLWLSLRTITFHGFPSPDPVSGGRVRVSVTEPVVQVRVPARRDALGQLGTQLADGSVPLREHVVRVDGLEVDLPRVEEVAFVQLGETLERRGQRDPHRILDE